MPARKSNPNHIPLDEVRVIGGRPDPYSTSVADEALDALDNAVEWAEIAELDVYQLSFTTAANGGVTLSMRLLNPTPHTIAVAMGSYGKALKLKVLSPVFNAAVAADYGHNTDESSDADADDDGFGDALDDESDD